MVAVHHYNLGALPSTGDRRQVRPGEERRGKVGSGRWDDNGDQILYFSS